MVIKIGFCRNRHWWAIFSYLIRWVDFKDASHCYLEFVTDNGPWIVESVYPRGRIMHKSNWIKSYEPVYEFQFATSHDPEEVFKWAEIVIKNKEYSLWQNFIIGLTIVFNKAFSNLENKELNGRKSVNCTEVVAQFIEDWLKTDVMESLDNMSISELYDICSKLPWEKTNGTFSNNRSGLVGPS